MSVIDFNHRTIKYYDSMRGTNTPVLNGLRDYLQEESLNKRNVPFDTSDWTMECVDDCPEQGNGYDCGVFCCQVAEYIARGEPLTFTQQDMPRLRQQMRREITKGELEN